MEVRKELKIVQVENGFVHWDASPVVPSLEWAATHYAQNIVFVEAPDYVFEGWTFDEDKEGDERFIKPVPPEGWLYDDATGAFYQEEENKPIDRLTSVFENVINEI